MKALRFRLWGSPGRYDYGSGRFSHRWARLLDGELATNPRVFSHSRPEDDAREVAALVERLGGRVLDAGEPPALGGVPEGAIA